MLRVCAAAAGVGAVMLLGQATASADDTDGATSAGAKSTGGSARSAHSSGAKASAASATSQRVAARSVTSTSTSSARTATARAIPTPGALAQQIYTAINSLFFNAAPSVDPLTTRRGQSGVITGTLRASDAESDPIRYAVAKGPEFGSVTIDSSGTYTYTPTAGYEDDGGVDEFVVAVVDTTQFLGIPRHIDFESVTVVRGNTGPQVVSAPTVVARDEDTGLVSGTVSVIDADGDPVTYSYGGDLDPALGTLTVDPITGSWTVQPTESAIAKAESTASPDDDYASFTINATQVGAAVAGTTSMLATAPVVPEYVISQPITRSAPLRVVFHNMIAPTGVDAPSVLSSTTTSVGGRSTAVATSPDGTLVYVVSRSTRTNQPGTLTVIDAATGGVVATVATGSTPTDIAVSPDGSRVFVGNGGDRSVTVVDTETKTVAATIQGAYRDLSIGGGLAISPDGSTLYTANSGGRVTVIDTATNKVTTTFAVATGPASVNGVALSPDGTTLYVTAGDTLKVVKAADGSVTSTVALQYTYTVDSYVSSGVYSERVPATTYTNTLLGTRILVSADGKTLYVSTRPNIVVSSTGNGALLVIDTATASVKTVASIPFGRIDSVDFPKYLASSPDGSKVYYADSLYLYAMDAATNAVTRYRVDLQLNGQPLVIGSDGTTAYLASFSQQRGGYLQSISLT